MMLLTMLMNINAFGRPGLLLTAGDLSSEPHSKHWQDDSQTCTLPHTGCKRTYSSRLRLLQCPTGPAKRLCETQPAKPAAQPQETYSTPLLLLAHGCFRGSRFTPALPLKHQYPSLRPCSLSYSKGETQQDSSPGKNTSFPLDGLAASRLKVGCVLYRGDASRRKLHRSAAPPLGQGLIG